MSTGEPTLGEICVTLKRSLASAMPKSWLVHETARGDPGAEPTALEG
jgi:hypothetical protein